MQVIRRCDERTMEVRAEARSEEGIRARVRMGCRQHDTGNG